MSSTATEAVDTDDLRCEWEPNGCLVLAGAAVSDLTPEESRQLEAYLRTFVKGRVEEFRERRIDQVGALS